MKLTKKEFAILVALAESPTKLLSQRELSKQTGVSLGTVNKILAGFCENHLAGPSGITENGLEVLEQYRVKKAIFIAAGFGSRLVPITLNTPNPLVRVKGVRMIDTMLDAIIALGIDDITIVRGYLSEQFDQLLYKYPMIKFTENPLYRETNNISSAMPVRHNLQNTYIMDGDFVLLNPAILKKYHYQSNYLGVPVERTDDWCLEVKNDIITDMKIGGINCYQMFGVSYWNSEDGAKLAEHIRLTYEMPGGRERFWDEAALYCFSSEYKVAVTECTFDDIIEIDSYNDLKKLDNSYI